MTADLAAHTAEAPIALPPSPFIRSFGRLLAVATGEAGVVIDLGCCTGRNSLYLARLGCRVLGLDANESALQTAQLLANREGMDNCRFVRGDILDLGLAGSCSAIVINEVLHQVPRSPAVIFEEARGLTMPGGYHAISGYLRGDETRGDQAAYFAPGELQAAYARDREWEIVDYSEAMASSCLVNNQVVDTWLATLVARRISRG